MKKCKIAVLVAVIVGLSASVSSAASINLFDWNFYVDGTPYKKFPGGDSMPTTGSLNGSGLGSLSWSTSAGGSHTLLAMFDHEIDEGVNTFFNEYGFTGGTPASGQSWEIDEPGYLFGDIYDNVLAGALDNTNGVPAGSEDDVSMALGWDFTLGADETAVITLSLSKVMPTSGFYLAQVDPDSQCTLYFSSNLAVRDKTVIPELATMFLVGSGLAGLFGYNRRKKIGG